MDTPHHHQPTLFMVNFSSRAQVCCPSCKYSHKLLGSRFKANKRKCFFQLGEFIATGNCGDESINGLKKKKKGKTERQMERTGPAVWLLPSAQEIPLRAVRWGWIGEAPLPALGTSVQVLGHRPAGLGNPQSMVSAVPQPLLDQNTCENAQKDLVLMES